MANSRIVEPGKELESFRLITENVTDLIAVLDTQGRRLYNSPSYRRLFGDGDEVIATNSFAEIHPDDRERIRQTFHQAVATGHGQRAEFRFLLKDGSVRYIESQSSVMHSADGRGDKRRRCLP